MNTPEKAIPENGGKGSAGRALAGFPIGVLCIDTRHDLFAGNMQHARTYSFPPIYEVVRDVEPAQLFTGDPRLAPRIVDACRRLADQGVRGIVGACGSFAYYQDEVRRAVSIPVCLSILVQLPFLLATLPLGQKLLVYFARTSSTTEALLTALGVDAQARQRLITAEAMTLPEFSGYIEGRRVTQECLQEAIVAQILALRDQHPDLGGIVLQCSDLPPFAAALQRATGLPVHDGTLVAEWLASAVMRSDYSPGSRRCG